MKKILFPLTLLFLFAGCASKNELKGIQEIGSFYGGHITWSKGFKAGEKKNNGSYFEIKLDSTDIKQYFPTEDLPAANCAYLFFHSLSEKEKSSYSYIRVRISEYSQSDSYIVQTADLRTVEKCIPTLDRTVDCLKNKQYGALRNLFDPSVSDSVSEERIRENNRGIDSAYGQVRDFVLQGFTTLTITIEGREIHAIRMKGNLVREKQNTFFNAIIDPGRKERNLYGYAFKQ